MAVIHETGHAMYEQGRPHAWRSQPVGRARGAAVHESQSLLMEMQAARSDEFLTHLAPIIRRTFSAGESEPAWSTDNLRRLYRKVERGLIRVDADEITYPLHVILRYEIERALIEGKAEVRDIPGLWDEKMQAYLGRDTRGNYKDGCLQDIHWSEGLVGYFPTYSVGAMMAAQLFAAAHAAVPGLMERLGRGEFAGLVAWLREKVHGKASLLSMEDLLVEATGERLNQRYFTDHLTNRYLT